MSSKTEEITAEERFRQAFERLKSNRPETLEVGTPVSQNNVAKEAKCVASALRKSRFPSLIREIQAYIEIHNQIRPSQRQELLKKRAKRAELKKRLAVVTMERDVAQSQLLSAQRRVMELAAQLRRAEDELAAIKNVSKLKK